MSNLTKFQVNAVKSMSRAIQPLQRKLDRIHEKEIAFNASIATEKEDLQAQIDNANASIVLYTGGLTAEEVLNPESAVSEVAPEGVVDENAVAELVEILPATVVEEEVAEVSENDITGVEEAIEENIAESNGSVETESPVAEEEVPFWDRPAAK